MFVDEIKIFESNEQLDVQIIFNGLFSKYMDVYEDISVITVE